jgi:putative membrane protein
MVGIGERPGRRVDVAELEAVVRVDRAARDAEQRLARARERIDEDPRRLVRGLLEVERQHVVAVAGQGIALRPGVGLRLLRALLGEAGVEESDQRDVEAVEPDHRLAAVVAVVVEGPRRRDDEVAEAHRRALAVDGRVGAFAVEHQAQRRLRVPVRRRHLAGQDQLQPGVQRLRDRRLAAQGRVLEDQDAPLGLFGADEAAGVHDVAADLVVAPEGGGDRALRCRRHQRPEHFPERRHVQAVDARVEGTPLVGGRAFVQCSGLGRVHAVIVREHRGQVRWPAHGPHSTRAAMKLAADVLVALVAVLHVYFLVLEMFLWDKPFGRRTFGHSAEAAAATKVLPPTRGSTTAFSPRVSPGACRSAPRARR